VVKLIRDETGIALPLVIFVILALSLLGIILFNYNMAETTQVSRDEHRLKTHYLARSGAHAVAQYLVDNPDEIEEIISHGGESGEVTVPLGEGEYGKFQVLVYRSGEEEEEEEEEEDIVYVKSTGIFGNARQQVLVSILTEGINAPVIASDVDTRGKAFRILGGDVLLRDVTDDEFEEIRDAIEGGLEDDHEVMKTNQVFDHVILPCEDEEMGIFYGNCPTFPGDEYVSSEHLEITDSSYYERIHISNGTMLIDPNKHLLLKVDNIARESQQEDGSTNFDLTIKIGDKNVVALVVDEYQNRGDIKIQRDGIEGGHLLIYVKNFNTNVSGNEKIKYVDEDGDKLEGEELDDFLDVFNLNVFVTEGGTFNMGGTPYFEGSVYAPYADSVLAGDAAISGWILTDNVELQGNAEIDFMEIEMLDSSIDLETTNMHKWMDVD